MARENIVISKATYGPDGIDGSAVGRNLALTAVVLGIGGLLLSWTIIGAVVGAIGIVCGVIAILKSFGAKQRVTAAGREAHTSGATGLGTIGIVTGIAAIAVASALLIVANNAIEKCGHLDRTSNEYATCIRENTGGVGGKQK